MTTASAVCSTALESRCSLSSTRLRSLMSRNITTTSHRTPSIEHRCTADVHVGSFGRVWVSNEHFYVVGFLAADGTGERQLVGGSDVGPRHEKTERLGPCRGLSVSASPSRNRSRRPVCRQDAAGSIRDDDSIAETFEDIARESRVFPKADFGSVCRGSDEADEQFPRTERHSKHERRQPGPQRLREIRGRVSNQTPSPTSHFDELLG